jgi:dihydrofolate reductase
MWRAADKIVYSTTLSAAQSARTRIERHFDADQIRAMKSSAERDLTIGGSTLTALAFRHGLVDECHLFLSPVVVGGGLPALPVSARTPLELVGDRRFTNGTMQLHYRVKEQSPE